MKLKYHSKSKQKTNLKNKKNFASKLKILGINFLVFLPCFVIFLFITKLFFSNKNIGFAFALISALCFYRLFFRLFQYFQNQIAINNYILFLQALSNHLNLNRSLSLSISLACKDLIKLSQNKKLQNKLYKVQLSIKLSSSFSEIIILLKDTFPCIPAKTSLSLMAAPQVMGDNLYIFTKNTLVSLQNDEKFRKDVNAEQVKSFIETITVSSMPIVILLFLRLTARDFIELAYISTYGQIILGASYLLFFLGLMFILLVYIPNTKAASKQYSNIFVSRNKLIPKNLQNLLHNNALKILSKTTLPFQFKKIIKYSYLLERQENLNRDNLFSGLVIARFKYLLLGVFIMVVGLIFNLPLILLLTLFITIISYPDLKLIDRSNYYLRKINLDMQTFITALLSALSVGYTIESALIFCEKYGNLNEVLTKEISVINNKIINSSTSELALSEFTAVLNDKEIENFFYLIQNHTQANNKNSITQLELQFETIKEKLFNDRKKLVAIKSNNYLIPLMLNLVSIFLICLAPVLPSLQI